MTGQWSLFVSNSISQRMQWRDPVRPLRVLCLQAENPPNDAVFTAKGVLSALDLTEEERKLVAENTRYLWVPEYTGDLFLKEAERRCLEFNADILRVDPLLAYCAGDLKDPAVVARFCREGLNGIAARCGCGVIAAHHTPKTTNRDTSTWEPYDWQYALSGSAALANWSRAAMVIEPTGDDGVFMFIAAKRWPGWRNDDGEAVHVRYYRHGRGILLWEEASPDEITARGKVKPEDLLTLIHTEEGEIGKNTLIGDARDKLGLGENKARQFINELVERKLLFERLVPRSGTRPAKVLTIYRPPPPVAEQA